MRSNEPYLIINLNDDKIIFFVISFDENKNYKLIKNTVINSKGIQNGRVVDIELVVTLIKKVLNSLEDELNFFFSNTSVIINPNDINCLNVSGYKKLNGSQVSEEDITYILNDIKKTVSLNEDKYSLIHLFNSSFSIDSDNLENLPIGLFGEFYNQNMTFFMVNKNIPKNLKLVFNKCGLNIDRIILKPFVEGINFLLKNEYNKSFTSIILENKRISVSLFKNKSYVLAQDFNFGTDLIISDISKLCSMREDEVKFFLKEISLKEATEGNSDYYLDKVFFSTSPYRKIKYQFIIDIITARLDELFEICYKNNTNLNYFRKGNKAIYITIENCEYFKNIQFSLKKNKLIYPEFVFSKSINDISVSVLDGTAELIGKGWEREAIPVIHPKKSIISTFFTDLFD